MTYIARPKSRFSKLCSNKYQYSLFCIILIFCIITIFMTETKDPPIIYIDQEASFIRTDRICPFKGEKWIVITTINYPTPAIDKFLTLSPEWNLIVIADQKTPKDWLQHLTISSTRLFFVSFEQQKNFDFHILQYLSEESYARKNLGYLLAIKCGAKVIFESDDDNLLDTNATYLLPKVLQPQQVPWIAFHRQRSPFINIYGSFGHPQIWPRGFPIDELRNVTEDGWHSVKRNVDNNTHAYIQQYLADLDPDVDALVSFLFFISLHLNRQSFSFSIV